MLTTYWGDPIRLESTQRIDKPWWSFPLANLGNPEKGGAYRNDSGIRQLFKDVEETPFGLVEDAILEARIGHNSRNRMVTWSDDNA